MTIKKAKTSDVKTIHRLINNAAKKEEMLPRSLNDLYENLRDLVICVEDGRVQGVCALHVLWEDLAEIRSLVVKQESQGRGIGKALLEMSIKEARALGAKRVFVLTYKPGYFKKFGFKDIDKSELPQKIWGDCLRCPKFPECDELAVIKELV